MRSIVAVTVLATGSTITTSGTSASVTIPNTASGTLPKYVRVAATVAAYVKLDKTSATAAAGDVLVQPGDAVVLVVGNCDKIAAIQVTAAGVVQVSPVEDQ